MEKKNFTIGLLSLSAVVLMLVNYFAAQPAQAILSIKDRDYSLVTARTQTGGDSLYVLGGFDLTGNALTSIERATIHPDGSLVAMGPDHPITGGYLQPLTVLWNERWKLAQLTPGERVVFRTY